MSRPQPIRVLVIDDSAFSRQVITRMLAASPLVDVVGVARGGEELLRLLKRGAEFPQELLTENERLQDVEEENRHFADRYVEVEEVGGDSRPSHSGRRGAGTRRAATILHSPASAYRSSSRSVRSTRSRA